MLGKQVRQTIHTGVVPMRHTPSHHGPPCTWCEAISKNLWVLAVPLLADANFNPVLAGTGHHSPDHHCFKKQADIFFGFSASMGLLFTGILSHNIIELFTVEKILKIIKSNHKSNTAKWATNPCPTLKHASKHLHTTHTAFLLLSLPPPKPVGRSTTCSNCTRWQSTAIQS